MRCCAPVIAVVALVFVAAACGDKKGGTVGQAGMSNAHPLRVGKPSGWCAPRDAYLMCQGESGDFGATVTALLEQCREVRAEGSRTLVNCVMNRQWEIEMICDPEYPGLSESLREVGGMACRITMEERLKRGGSSSLPEAEPTETTNDASGAPAFFHSPSGNIQCEVDAEHADCQTFEPMRSVTLKPDGMDSVCRGEGCVGNGPETAGRLAYGKSLSVGPFQCLSEENGVICLVSSHGFRISREQLTSWSNWRQLGVEYCLASGGERFQVVGLELVAHQAGAADADVNQAYGGASDAGCVGSD
jgi:hypothetical protein